MVMDCLNAYIKACRLAFKGTPDNYTDKLKCDTGKSGQACYYSEMYSVLSTLRNFLSCDKCGKLASDAVKVLSIVKSKETDNTLDIDSDDEPLSNGKISAETEQRLVICLGCAERLTMKVIEPFAQTRTLVQCYVKLCQYLQSSGFCNRNLGSNCGAASSRTQRDLTQLILDGAGYRDGDHTGDSVLSRLLSRPPVKGRLSDDRTDHTVPKRRRFADNRKQSKVSRVKCKPNESNGGERKGCQCGHSTPRTGSSLTCFGQRCPCYSHGFGCHNCKCRGCKNPKKHLEQIEMAEPMKSLAEVFSTASSSTTSSSTISSSCSSSPHPEDAL
ncbi:hypothetical protein CHUAL_010655 [Chamberlinius hualienensis]